MAQSKDRIISEDRVENGHLGILHVGAVLKDRKVNRTLIEHPSGAVVLAYDPHRKVAAVLRQVRLPVLREGATPLREPAAGEQERDETPEEAAIRECFEETGIRLGSVERVAEVWMDPSTSTEREFVFLGAYTREDQDGPGGSAEGENERIRVQEESLADLWRAVETREPLYAGMLMCLQALRIKRPELF